MTEEKSASDPWVGKIVLPKQKFEIIQKPEYTIYKFSFSREGADEGEKGQMFINKPGDADRLIENMNNETPFEVTIGPVPKYGHYTVSFPKAFGKPGGGGRPAKEYPPHYRGKALSEKQFFDVYDRIKSHVYTKNKKVYEGLQVADFAELVRSETSQIVIMLKDNVWIPDEVK